MRKLVLTIASAGLLISSSQAQTLFTFGSIPVSKQDFLRNYSKNAQNKQPDYSSKAVNDYLELYSLFRMKVQEADNQHLDTLSGIQRELDTYRKQLAKSYLTDEVANQRLYREAYDRMKEERHVAHILIMASPALSPQDSLIAYNRIDSIYNAITKKKADFGKLAEKYSDDRGSKERGGDIGYMTALQTLYPFENAVYNTPKGKVSSPFRTQLGYHIVKVIDTRPSRGEIEVAQILIATPKSKGEAGIEAAKKTADSVEVMLKKGASFTDLVKKYSEDKFSIENNGVLPQFGVGRMIPAFEDAAFSLKSPGDISAPVLTEYGYHIIKLIKKYPIKPYDSLIVQIKKQVDNDSRAQMARELYVMKVKQSNGFQEYPANIDEVAKRMSTIPDTGKFANEFQASNFNDLNKPMFKLSGITYSQRDFLTFSENLTRGKLIGPREVIVKDLYKLYSDRVLNDFQEHKLEAENEDFRNLMHEYRDGILLFELMDQNVWGKASRDSVGLSKFYEANKSKYQWEPGFTGVLYRFKDEASLKKGMSLLRVPKPISDDKLLTEMNKEGEIVSIQQGRFEFSKLSGLDRNKLVKGKLSDPIKNDDGSYSVAKPNIIYNTNSQKSIDDARGYVVAEYQDYLEKKWNNDLRKKYPVKVNEAVLHSIIK
ncbi:MAG: peptidyl-prolyl cis-trans isomerase [Bacteroidetes bacterium]|nr:peptidyl-prolyl cis-trans isomerase [Bacteroidota bacterium]